MRWDDVKGGWFDPALKRKARQEKTQYLKMHAVHEKVPMSQCWMETGWAGTIKGTSECPNMRPRSTANGRNNGFRPNLFSATSHLEGVKPVISEAASSIKKVMLLQVKDVWRVYFCAKAKWRVHVELPEGDGGGPGTHQLPVGDTELVRHPCSELGMRPLRVPGGDWLAQGESKHVPKLCRDTENQRLGPP